LNNERRDLRYDPAMTAKPFVVAALLTGCGGGGGSSGGGGPTPPPPVVQYYLPLAVGNRWTYTCTYRNPPMAGSFTKTDSVTGTQTVNGVRTYVFALHIVNSPTQIITWNMLLANDAQGNLTLYGYLVNGSVQTITPIVIVAATGTPGKQYTGYYYPAPDGSTVHRYFYGNELTNPTPLGTFRVAAYFENNGSWDTRGYGYTLGQGITEDSEAPNVPEQYDCLINSIQLH